MKEIDSIFEDAYLESRVLSQLHDDEQTEINTELNESESDAPEGPVYDLREGSNLSDLE